MKKMVYKFMMIGLMLGSSYSLFAHVELDNPKGGETFIAGTTVNIQWHITIAHTTLNWDLYYSNDGGMSWEVIQEDLAPNALSYQWHVPSEATSLARVSVIQDNEGQDYQDESNNFTIESATATSEINSFALTVGPNPATEELMIDGGQNPLDEAVLFDPDGKKIWSYRGADKMVRVFVQNYPAGIYLLRVRMQDTDVIRRVVIQ